MRSLMILSESDSSDHPASFLRLPLLYALGRTVLHVEKDLDVNHV